MNRPAFYEFHQRNKTLPFSDVEYETRINRLRHTMREQGLDACLFTSMHNIAYFSGFCTALLGVPIG